MRNRSKLLRRCARARTVFGDLLEERHLLSVVSAPAEDSVPAEVRSWDVGATGDSGTAAVSTETAVAPTAAETDGEAGPAPTRQTFPVAGEDSASPAGASAASDAPTSAATPEGEGSGIAPIAHVAVSTASTTTFEDATVSSYASAGAAASSSSAPAASSAVGDEMDNLSAKGDELEAASAVGNAAAASAAPSVAPAALGTSTLDAAAPAAAAPPVQTTIADPAPAAATVTVVPSAKAPTALSPAVLAAPTAQAVAGLANPMRAESSAIVPPFTASIPADGSERSPAPVRPADLLASFSPFDRAALDRAFDQLLERFGSLEADLSEWGTAERLVPYVMASALVVGAADVVRRRMRADETDEAADDELRTGSPFGLPDYWALEER